MNYPTLEDIVRTNRVHLEASGEDFLGADNLRERGGLEWVLDAIQHPLFNVDRYPSLAEKAAKLAWAITADHAFWDDNKRTGMSVLQTFLRVNGYRLRVTSDEIVEISRRLAKKELSFDAFVQWVRERIVLAEGLAGP